MANPKLRLGFREPEVDTHRAFVDGDAGIEGFDLEIVDFKGPDSVDAWDASFGNLMARHGKGRFPFTCIPAFPNRKFRLSFVFVNAQSGVESPKDLEGKRVAVFAWDNTAGVWARSALVDHYGLDDTKVTWLFAGEVGAPWGPGVRVEALPDPSESHGGKLDWFDGLLLDGTVDAAIAPDLLPSIARGDARVCRLFPDSKKAEQAYFRATGVFPTSHVVALHQDYVAAHPDAPAALLTAYRKARDIALERLFALPEEINTLSWLTGLIEEQRALMGENYWPYNLADNARALEALMRAAHHFGLTPQTVDYRTLFDPKAAALPGA